MVVLEPTGRLRGYRARPIGALRDAGAKPVLVELEADDALAIIAALIENLPHRSMVALAGRAQPKLPVASLRVGGPLLEIGTFELALSRREAEILLRACAVELDEQGISELLQRTEGWAAGIFLTALAARDCRESVDSPAGGAHRS